MKKRPMPRFRHIVVEGVKPFKMTKFIRTKEDWCPSIVSDGNFLNDAYNHSLGCDGLRVSLIRLNSEKEIWRVCVWGGDDFGMEYDQSSKEIAQEMYDLIDDYTTRQELKALGFDRA